MKAQATDIHPALARPIEWGHIVLSHKDNSAHSQMVDRLAYDGDTMCFLSCVAPANQIKAFRAILHTQSGSPAIHVSHMKVRRPSQDAFKDVTPGYLSISRDGYSLQVHRLEFGLVHAVFIARDESFITYLDPENLWLKLNTNAYTTPLLKSWMPYVTKKLIEDRRLRECRCYRCNSGTLDIKSDSILDEIVSDGIKSGEIRIS